MNILFIGDVVGGDAIKAITAELPTLKQKYKTDFVIANGENAAGGSEGFGIGSCLLRINLTSPGKSVFCRSNFKAKG